MPNYLANFQRATVLFDGLEQRGFRGQSLGYPNGYSYKRRINEDFDLDLHFSPRGDNLGSVGILIGSMSVTRAMHSLSLFVDIQITPIDKPEVVLAVDLIWLRWNHDPERAVDHQHDYKLGTDNGILRLLEDLDTVGRNFIAAVSTPSAMAEQLANLNDYPCHAKWGGRPVSVDPYVYAAILFLESGDKAQAKEVLDKGWGEYNTAAPRPYWQSVRLQRFQVRRMLLLRHMGYL